MLVGLAAGSFYAPLTSSTTKWFTQNRSLAVALVSAGLGLGATVDGAAGALAITTSYDWRVAMLVMGNLAWLVIIPAALLVRTPPAAAAGTTSAADAGSGGRVFTAAQAFRTPQFAAIAVAHFACCAAHSGPIFHMVTNAMDHGITAMAAATVFSVAGVGSLAGKIVCGLVADRIGAKRMLLTGLALQAFAISLYTVIGELASFYALALLFGFSYGGVMPLYAIVVREYFGARIMGTAFGAVGFVATLGMALGPWRAGGSTTASAAISGCTWARSGSGWGRWPSRSRSGRPVRWRPGCRARPRPLTERHPRVAGSRDALPPPPPQWTTTS